MKRIAEAVFVMAVFVAGWFATPYLTQVLAQSASPASGTPTISFTQYPLTPISATAAVANATTLTIPAPTQSGFYNYICYLALEGSNNNTAGAVSVATGSTTNFNNVAFKLSTPSAASNDTGVLVYFNSVAPGCPKSVSPTTATTFVSPNSTSEAYSWYAVYFQAP